MKTSAFLDKTKVVELLERNKNVQLPQPPSHVLSPSVTALCEGLWARTLMTVRCLPPVDVQGFGTVVAGHRRKQQSVDLKACNSEAQTQNTRAARRSRRRASLTKGTKGTNGK